MKKELLRRDFLKGAAVGAMGVATLGIVGACASTASDGKSDATPNAEAAAPTTFQEQCALAGIALEYEDPNTSLSQWSANLPDGVESDLIPSLDALSGASMGTTYYSVSQQSSTIKSFEQFADRQNQKIRTYGWYPKSSWTSMRTGLYYEVVEPPVTSLEEAAALPEAKHIKDLFPDDASADNPYKLCALLGFAGTETFMAPDVRWVENYDGEGNGKLVNGDENGVQNANCCFLRQIGFMKQPATDPYNYSGVDRYVHIINIGHHSVQYLWRDPDTKEAVEEGAPGAELFQVDPIESVAKSAVMNGNMRTCYIERDPRGFFGLGTAYYSEIFYEMDYDALVFFNQVTAGLPICMSDNTEQQIRLYPEQEISPYIGQDYNDQGEWENGAQAWERS